MESRTTFRYVLSLNLRTGMTIMVATGIRLFLDVLGLTLSDQSPHSVGVWFGHCSRTDRIESCAVVGLTEVFLATSFAGFFVWYYYANYLYFQTNQLILISPTVSQDSNIIVSPEEHTSRMEWISGLFQKFTTQTFIFVRSSKVLIAVISWPIVIGGLEWLPVGLVVSKASIFLEIWSYALRTYLGLSSQMINGLAFMCIVTSICSYLNYRMLRQKTTYQQQSALGHQQPLSFVYFLFVYGFGWVVGFISWSLVSQVLSEMCTDNQTRLCVMLGLIGLSASFYVTYGPEPVLPHESIFNSGPGSGLRSVSRNYVKLWRSFLSFLVYTSVVFLIMAFSDPNYGLVHLLTKTLVENRITVEDHKSRILMEQVSVSERILDDVPPLPEIETKVERKEIDESEVAANKDAGPTANNNEAKTIVANPVVKSKPTPVPNVADPNPILSPMSDSGTMVVETIPSNVISSLAKNILDSVTSKEGPSLDGQKLEPKEQGNQTTPSNFIKRVAVETETGKNLSKDLRPLENLSEDMSSDSAVGKPDSASAVEKLNSTSNEMKLWSPGTSTASNDSTSPQAKTSSDSTESTRFDSNVSASSPKSTEDVKPSVSGGDVLPNALSDIKVASADSKSASESGEETNKGATMKTSDTDDAKTRESGAIETTVAPEANSAEVEAPETEAAETEGPKTTANFDTTAVPPTDVPKTIASQTDSPKIAAQRPETIIYHEYKFPKLDVLSFLVFLVITMLFTASASFVSFLIRWGNPSVNFGQSSKYSRMKIERDAEEIERWQRLLVATDPDSTGGTEIPMPMMSRSSMERSPPMGRMERSPPMDRSGVLDRSRISVGGLALGSSSDGRPDGTSARSDRDGAYHVSDENVSYEGENTYSNSDDYSGYVDLDIASSSTNELGALSKFSILFILINDVLGSVVAFSWSQLVVAFYSTFLVATNNVVTCVTCFIYMVTVISIACKIARDYLL